MKRKLIVVLIYLSGCFTSYVTFKHTLIESKHRWTKGDRSFAIVVSAFSWLSVLAVGGAVLAESCRNNNEEASW